jgi:hypothetical protein
MWVFHGPVHEHVDEQTLDIVKRGWSDKNPEVQVLMYETDVVACQNPILKCSEGQKVSSKDYKILYYTILCSKLSPLL